MDRYDDIRPGAADGVRSDETEVDTSDLYASVPDLQAEVPAEVEDLQEIEVDTARLSYLHQGTAEYFELQDAVVFHVGEGAAVSATTRAELGDGATVSELRGAGTDTAATALPSAEPTAPVSDLGDGGSGLATREPAYMPRAEGGSASRLSLLRSDPDGSAGRTGEDARAANPPVSGAERTNGSDLTGSEEADDRGSGTDFDGVSDELGEAEPGAGVADGGGSEDPVTGDGNDSEIGGVDAPIESPEGLPDVDPPTERSTDEAPDGLVFTPQTLFENAPAAVAGTLAAADPEGAALTWSVDDPRFVVDGTTLRLADGVALDREAEPEVTLTVTAADPAGQTVSRTLTLGVADEITEPPQVSVAGSFHVRQISVLDGTTDLAGVDWGSEPLDEIYVARVDFAEKFSGFFDGSRDDLFATLVTGNIAVETAGLHSFRIPATDTSILWIDGEPVVVDAIPGPLGTSVGTVYLEAGQHEVIIQHLDISGSSELRLEWMTPGHAEFELTPPSDDFEVEEDESIGLNVTIDAGGNSIGAVMARDVAQNWILSDGTLSTIATGSDIDLTGWNLGQLEVTPALGDVGSHAFTLEVTALSATGEPGVALLPIRIDVAPDDGLSTENLNAQDVLDAVLNPLETGATDGTPGNADPIGDTGAAVEPLTDEIDVPLVF